MIGEHDPTDIDAEVERNAEAEAAAKHAAAIEKEDWRGLLRAPGGRRIVWALLAKTHVFQSSITGEPLTTFAREGERNIGLFVLDKVNEHMPEAYVTMLEEAKNV